MRSRLQDSVDASTWSTHKQQQQQQQSAATATATISNSNNQQSINLATLQLHAPLLLPHTHISTCHQGHSNHTICIMQMKG
jgi:hypothetical protein